MENIKVAMKADGNNFVSDAVKLNHRNLLLLFECIAGANVSLQFSDDKERWIGDPESEMAADEGLNGLSYSNAHAGAFVRVLADSELSNVTLTLS